MDQQATKILGLPYMWRDGLISYKDQEVISPNSPMTK